MTHDPEWQKIRQTEDQVLNQHLLPFASALNKDLIRIAWNDFLIRFKHWSDEVSESFYQNLFVSWFLFDWIPHHPKQAIKNSPIALQYLAKQDNRLTDYQRQFIQAMSQT